jgi:hypothetical protein
MPQWAGDTKRASEYEQWKRDNKLDDSEQVNAQRLDALVKAKREHELQRAMEMGALAAGVSNQATNISNAMEELAQRANTKAIPNPIYTGVQAGAAQGRAPFKQGMNRFTDGNMYSMLASRMGWNLVTASPPFDKCVPCKVTEEKAVVFIVTGGKALLIEDDLGLYPSDALVTQLRLLEP